MRRFGIGVTVGRRFWSQQRRLPHTEEDGRGRRTSFLEQVVTEVAPNELQVFNDYAIGESAKLRIGPRGRPLRRARRSRAAS